MLLDALLDDAAVHALGDEAFALMRELYPKNRSLTGAGLRSTLDAVAQWAPMQRHEVASGTPLFDWTAPREWTLREAWIAGPDGRRLIDVAQHTLHIVGYSGPVRGVFTRAELEPHLHSLPERANDIPYRTRYHEEGWGFCLRQTQRDALGDGPFEVCIDSDLGPGHMSWAECVIPGRSDDEAVLFTHVCHPSLANDNVSGIAVAAALARALTQGETPTLTWRVVFAPATLGSLAWLAHHEAHLSRVRAGLVISLLGDAGPLNYKPSRRGDTLIDRAARLVLPGINGHELPWEPYGYDERQFTSPGFDLPFGRLTRTPNGRYPEYHTSADDLSLVSAAQLAGSLQAIARIAQIVDGNARLLNLLPKGEPQLGRRGLYDNVGGPGLHNDVHATLWLLALGDGRHDLIDIARRSDLPFGTLVRVARKLIDAGLLADNNKSNSTEVSR